MIKRQLALDEIVNRGPRIQLFREDKRTLKVKFEGFKAGPQNMNTRFFL